MQLYFVLQETQRLMQEPVPGINAVPDEQNARYFHVVVAGELTLSELFIISWMKGMNVGKEDKIMLYAGRYSCCLNYK